MRLRITTPPADTARMKMHEDTRDLTILAAWQAGLGVTKIARQVKSKPHLVRDRIRNLIRADIAHDPLAKEYWNNL